MDYYGACDKIRKRPPTAKKRKRSTWSMQHQLVYGGAHLRKRQSNRYFLHEMAQVCEEWKDDRVRSLFETFGVSKLVGPVCRWEPRAGGKMKRPMAPSTSASANSPKPTSRPSAGPSAAATAPSRKMERPTVESTSPSPSACVDMMRKPGLRVIFPL